MHSQRGSVLAITTVFVLAFTMLGFAAIYFSGTQSEYVEEVASSTKAFWLAEAGVERAFVNLPDSLFNVTNETLGEGSYNVITANYTYADGTVATDRWNITSTGFVMPVNKTIRAEVGSNVLKAVITTGTLRGPGSGGLDGHIDPDGSYEQNATFSFEGVFGINQTTMYDMRTSNPDPGNNPSTADGIIWVKDGDVKINAGWEHSGIMIVNGDLKIDGGHFTGVIWVNGGCKVVNGDDVIDGAVLVNDPLEDETKINGNSAITFSREAIDVAFGLISDTHPESVHNIILWRETD